MHRLANADNRTSMSAGLVKAHQEAKDSCPTKVAEVHAKKWGKQWTSQVCTGVAPEVALADVLALCRRKFLSEKPSEPIAVGPFCAAAKAYGDRKVLGPVFFSNSY